MKRSKKGKKVIIGQGTETRNSKEQLIITKLRKVIKRAYMKNKEEN